MKKSFLGFDIEISDWTPNLRIATIISAVITLISSAITLLWKYRIPGLTPLAFSLTMLLLGVRELNVYFKVKHNKYFLVMGVIFTLGYAFNLIVGILQILTAVSKYV